MKISVSKQIAEQEKGRLHLLLAIEDTGIGIKEDQLEVVFESFQQQSGQNTRKFGGTGLGMAITKRLVEMMEGLISVQSTLGEGSVFHVYLPHIAVVQATEPIIPPAAITAKGLLAEDFLSDKLSEEVKEKIPRLLEELHQELLPLWEETRRRFVITQIESFAGRVKAIGEAYQFTPLMHYGNTLLNYANSFDMEQLPPALTEFPTFIEKLKAILPNRTSVL